MGAVLALVVVLVLVLAWGGGGNRAVRPASTTTTASPAAYPAAAQRAYLDACVGSTPDRRSFCDCTLGQLQHSMTWAEFRQVGQQATNGDPAARPRYTCLLYTSDAADEEDSVDLGGRRIIKKKKKKRK